MLAGFGSRAEPGESQPWLHVNDGCWLTPEIVGQLLRDTLQGLAEAVCKRVLTKDMRALAWV